MSTRERIFRLGFGAVSIYCYAAAIVYAVVHGDVSMAAVYAGLYGAILWVALCDEIDGI